MGKLNFGIYAGGAAGSENGLARGPVDVSELINLRLQELQSGKSSFLVRCYLHYVGNNRMENFTPAFATEYAQNGRKLDLVLGFQSQDGDIEDWKCFIKSKIAEHASVLGKIQIAEEPNLHGIPYVDGDKPNVRAAVVEGVIAAKNEVRRLNLDVQVGFNAVLTFDPANDFWRSINRIASPEFYHSLDYVGLDFFPDVFRPVEVDSVESGVTGALRHFREVSLKEAGIGPDVALHITEHGWATSPDRTYERQALIIEKVIRKINEVRDEFNITHYELFSLRDANSANPNFFYQFGITTDTYEPKPAFHTYRKLIAELG